MKIDVICVACYKRDFRLTRALVANIRHWYPDIRIELLKDENMMAFDTSLLERTYDVHVFPCEDRVFGMGFFKFEPLIRMDGRRLLMLDSDIILAGPVIGQLEQHDEDFLVVTEEDTDDNRNSYYFNLDDVAAFDPEFRYPGFTFNTGQFVATGGVLKREDFDGLVEWGTPRRVLQRDVFPYHGEQPILNYMALKRHAAGSLSIRRIDFMRESRHPDSMAVELDHIMSGKGYHFLIHWHDHKPKVNLPSLKHLARKDLILHFEKAFFRKAGYGTRRQAFNLFWFYILDELFLLAIKMKDIIGNLRFRRK